MTNPNGAVAGNSQNVPEAQTPRTRSTFPLHYHFFNTHRFGEYIPHYVEDANKDESFPIHSAHDLRSYTLESPLMQNVKRNKDYFMVPMEAILPLNWEKFFDNPVRGDDVLDDVGPSVANFWRKVGAFMNALNSSLSSILGNTSTTAPIALQSVFRYLVLGEMFYSNGSLMASLGCHGAPYVQVSFSGSNRPRCFDEVFDAFLTTISAGLGSGSFTMLVDGINYVVIIGQNPATWPGQSSISLRHALQLMRDNPTFQITSWSGTASASSFVTSLAGTLASWTITPILADVPFDASRLWAYQICCSHFFSNDHIDFVYSADLFRQLIGNYVYAQTSTYFTSSLRFTRNGSIYLYDYCSAHFLSLFLTTYTTGGNPNYLLQAISNSADIMAALGYFSALFSYRRSLRYLDYFTGSRAQPLAIANSNVNTNVSVNNNLVSVIDITKSIQAQRFLNAVNRVRHNFEGYLKGIFGGKLPAPDYHNPFYLAHTDDVIFGQETENTGAAQMSDGIAITTNLRSSSNNYMFDCQTDRPAIIIGITSYDISRVYTKSMERAFLKQNRFDYFNPFMQYIGDQPIYVQELGINPVTGTLATLKNFSYTIRHEEYKQRYSQAAGGFVENLPGWLFIASDERGTQVNINPDWIRSVSAEFDRFYVSLTGYSLGSYFHFIVDDFNSVNASRPMAYAPTIL